MDCDISPYFRIHSLPEIIVHPPVESSLRVTTNVDNLFGKGGRITGRYNARMNIRTVRAGVTGQVVAGQVDGMVFGCACQLGINRQFRQAVLLTLTVDQDLNLNHVASVLTDITTGSTS